MSWYRVAGVALAVWLAAHAGLARAEQVQAGFNDVTGINGDGIANNLPYNISGAPLNGQGATEPGWAGPWRVSGGAVVQGSTVFEGDGAAAFFQNTASASRVLSQAPTDRFSIDVRLMVPRSITRDVIFRVYDNGIADIFQAIAVQWQVLPDFTFYVVDGIEDSCPTDLCEVENTGLRLTPGAWAQVRVEIDPVSRTWDFFVDGVRYNAPDPLGFRGVPQRLDALELLNEIAAPDGSFLDAVIINTGMVAGVVPEPSGWALAGLGAVGLAAGRVWRHGRRR